MTARRLLLDVNVWIALLDDAHTMSVRANALIETPAVAIATCPIVENGTVRVLNSASYRSSGPVGLQRVRDQIGLACRSLDHELWPDAVSLTDDAVFDFTRIHGSNQITDAYLLALAVQNGGTLVTFDQRITLDAVRGSSAEHLHVLRA